VNDFLTTDNSKQDIQADLFRFIICKQIIQIQKEKIKSKTEKMPEKISKCNPINKKK
jgi:hypothetical protein